MAIGIYSLLEAIVLCLNAVCILNEERFLVKLPGWGSTHVQGFGEEPGIKNQVFNLIRSIKTVMKSNAMIPTEGEELRSPKQEINTATEQQICDGCHTVADSSFCTHSFTTAVLEYAQLTAFPPPSGFPKAFARPFHIPSTMHISGSSTPIYHITPVHSVQSTPFSLLDNQTSLIQSFPHSVSPFPWPPPTHPSAYRSSHSNERFHHNFQIDIRMM